MYETSFIQSLIGCFEHRVGMENETESSEPAVTGNGKKLIAAASLGVVITLMLVAIGLAFSNGVVGQSPATNGAAYVPVTGVAGTASVKEFTLTISNGDYQPNPITVNKGDTVRLVADLNSIKGCYRTVVIPKFGVRKTLSTTDNVIEFVASEAGTFRMTCGMGMAGGSIVVKDANGAVPATTDVSAQKTQGSCGSGGGCGCGGG